jgi:hypothetical protein
MSVFLAVLFTLLFLALPPAKADSFSWSWSLSGNGFNGSGTLTSDTTQNHYIFGYGYLVSSMDGQLNGTSLILNRNDSLIFSLGVPRNQYCGPVTACVPESDVIPSWSSGLGFSTSDGTSWILLQNEWNNTPLPFNLIEGRGESGGGNVNISIVPTPEPSALALFGLGLISLLGLAAVKRYVPHRVRPVRRKQFQFQS